MVSHDFRIFSYYLQSNLQSKNYHGWGGHNIIQRSELVSKSFEKGILKVIGRTEHFEPGPAYENQIGRNGIAYPGSKRFYS